MVPDASEATSSEGGYKRTPRGCEWSYGAITTVLQPWGRYELINNTERGGGGVVVVLFCFFVFLVWDNLLQLRKHIQVFWRERQRRSTIYILRQDARFIVYA